MHITLIRFNVRVAFSRRIALSDSLSVLLIGNYLIYSFISYNKNVGFRMNNIKLLSSGINVNEYIGLCKADASPIIYGSDHPYLYSVFRSCHSLKRRILFMLSRLVSLFYHILSNSSNTLPLLIISTHDN